MVVAVIVMFILFLFFILIKIPIFFSMAISSVISILVFSPEINLTIIPNNFFYGVNSFELLAVPFFIIAAELMNECEITDRIFNFADSLIGSFPGGLGQVNILASMIFAGMTGSGVADASGLGKVEVKAMLDRGYTPEFTAAVTASSAIIGPIIPPSIPMVLMGVITSTSSGRLLIGGFFPGLIIGGTLMLLVWILAFKRKIPISRKASFLLIWGNFKKAFLPLGTPIILIGGMLSGIFTPTEAAVVAVIYTLILGIFFYKKLKMGNLWQVLIRSAITSSKILIILCGAGIISSLVIRWNIIPPILNFFLSISQSPRCIFFLIILLILFLGCFLIDLAIMVIVIPTVMPIVIKIGLDPVHFGVVAVLSLMIAMITPPVGSIMYIICDYTNISIFQYIKEMIPFYIVLFGTIILVMFFPQIVLFLPNLIMG